MTQTPNTRTTVDSRGYLSFLRFPVAVLMGFAVAALGFAYVLQYGFGFAPCEMCLWQRYPYMAVIALGVLAYMLPSQKNILLWLISGAYFAVALIAGYHTGVEADIFEGLTRCASEGAVTADVDAMLADVMGAPIVSCKQPLAVFFGVSLAAWNALAAFAMTVVSLWLAWVARR